MCSTDVNRKLLKLIRLSMHHLFRVFLALCRKIFKLTLCQILWCIVGSAIIFVIFNWESDTDYSVIKGDGNPVILWWKTGFPGTEETRYCSNNAVCYVSSDANNSDTGSVSAFLFYASNINFDDLPLPRRPLDVIWGLYHEESPRNVEELLHEEALRLFNFSTTFSRYSNLPFPLQYLDSKVDIITKTYFIPTKEKNTLLDDISPVMYLQTDCETSTERDNYVKELMKYISVDSYGKCLSNKEFPEKFTVDYLNNLNDDTFLKFIARYKFVVAIENGVCHDYITEKFWRAIKVGTVPIYFGSPTVKDWFPNEKSAILLKDFPSPKLMADHLKNLLSNDTLYEEYLEHKTKEIVTNQRLLEELRDKEYQMDTLEVVRKFECLVCETLHGVHSTREAAGNVVDQNHYNCPKPISALTLNVNPMNPWVQSWQKAKTNAEKIYKRVMSS